MTKRHLFSKTDFLKIKELLKKKGQLSVEVVTGSMAPLIQPGQVLSVRPLSSNPKIFDILIFWSDDILICHYVSAKNSHQWNETERRLTTRSLISPFEDFPIPESHILGLVNVRLPWKYKVIAICKQLLYR